MPFRRSEVKDPRKHNLFNLPRIEHGRNTDEENREHTNIELAAPLAGRSAGVACVATTQMEWVMARNRETPRERGG